MATEVDICNMALGHIGDRAGISAIVPPDGSVQAEHCARFYPIVRDIMLEGHTWRFNTTRALMADLSAAIPPPTNWQYTYAIPNGCLRPLKVLAEGDTEEDGTEEFLVEADPSGVGVLFCNVPQATLRYLMKITDPTKFSPLFVFALSRLLASALAGPIIKGRAGVQEAVRQYQAFLLAKAEATAADANTRKTTTYQDFTPAWLSARQ